MNNVKPLVSSQTRTESMGIETVCNRFSSNRIVIPDYQRDAEQWDQRKQSLFIESIINNLTIPAFFFSTNDEGKSEVVDGQQRLTTILSFYRGDLKLSSGSDVVYLAPQANHYKGKKFDELPEIYKNAFTDYTLSIINLPENIDLNTKLEIFRRINEGGTPLSAQDIRLSYYSSSPSVYFIKLAGQYSQSKHMDRNESAASARNIHNPWNEYENAKIEWENWWEDKKLSKGQVPSEMFLWYLVAMNRETLNSLVEDSSSMSHLSIGYRGATEEILDIFCAQLHHDDENASVPLLPTYESGLQTHFAHYVKWIEFFLTKGGAGLSVDKYKQMALAIAALVELKISIHEVASDSKVRANIVELIRFPRKSGVKWLTKGYPEQKGRWGGAKGQKAQCEAAIEIIKNIVSS